MPLEDFRVDGAIETKDHPYNYSGVILSIDQSLKNSGWVLLDNKTLLASGTLHTDQSLKGPENLLDRTIILEEQFQKLLKNYCMRQVVGELPPTAPSFRPESSLLAAVALKMAARTLPLSLSFISSQKAKTIWTGNPNATKILVRKSLQQWWPELKEKKLNEHTYDAIANGLAWAEGFGNGSKKSQ